MRFAAPQGRGTAPASLTSSGPKKPRRETFLSMGSDWWRRTSCRREEEHLWTLSGAGGLPPTEGVFTFSSSQGWAPSLDEASVYWAGACSRPRTPAESEPSALRVPSMRGFAPSPYSPAEGLCVVPRGVGSGCWWTRLLKLPCMAPCPAVCLDHWRVLVLVKVAAS